MSHRLWILRYGLCGVLLAGLLVEPTRGHVGQDLYVEAGRLLDKGSFGQALALYEDLLKGEEHFDDQKRSRILNNVGFSHYKLGRLREAREYYHRALAIAPDYATCLNNLAVALVNEKRFSEALPYLERAFGLDKTAKVAFNLFAAHYYMDNRKEALAYIEESMRLDEAYTESRLKARNIKQKDIDRLKRRIK